MAQSLACLIGEHFPKPIPIFNPIAPIAVCLARTGFGAYKDGKCLANQQTKAGQACPPRGCERPVRQGCRMNWVFLRHCAWLDTRARFVAAAPPAASLLDLGSSDGATLGHMAELRPDLKFFAADIAGQPQNYPARCEFQRADFEKDTLRWPDGSMDAITCLQLIEHLRDPKNLLGEIARLLKPGGRVFFETPHPKSLLLSSPRGRAAGTFTLNFYDDLTHTQVVPMGGLACRVRQVGLEVTGTGISRNWLFAAAHPFFLFLPPSRKKFTAFVNWLGWSAFLVARRP